MAKKLLSNGQISWCRLTSLEVIREEVKGEVEIVSLGWNELLLINENQVSGELNHNASSIAKKQILGNVILTTEEEFKFCKFVFEDDYKADQEEKEEV